MIYRIKKYHHRAWPPIIGLHWNKKRMQRMVTFDRSAKYFLPGEDGEDVNKLFGIGYLPGPHTDSARFGWNYDHEKGKVALFAYCYVNGERSMIPLCDVPRNIRSFLSLDIIGDVYSFTVTDGYNHWHELGGCDVRFKHNKKLSYPLGVYFGGNQTAPQDINIEMKKK